MVSKLLKHTAAILEKNKTGFTITLKRDSFTFLGDNISSWNAIEMVQLKNDEAFAAPRADQ